MLKVFVYNSFYGNVPAYILLAGNEAANTPYDHINFNPCSTGLIQEVYEIRFFQVIYFYPDKCRLTFFCLLYFLVMRLSNLSRRLNWDTNSSSNFIVFLSITAFFFCMNSNNACNSLQTFLSIVSNT